MPTQRGRPRATTSSRTAQTRTPIGLVCVFLPNFGFLLLIHFRTRTLGYFSSRPTLKRYARMANAFFQVCKQVDMLARLGPRDRHDLNVMREAVGLVQHHDAIT